MDRASRVSHVYSLLSLERRLRGTETELTSGKLCRLQFCIPIKSLIVALRMFMLAVALGVSCG
jgi:DUF1365 family protein